MSEIDTITSCAMWFLNLVKVTKPIYGSGNEVKSFKISPGDDEKGVKLGKYLPEELH